MLFTKDMSNDEFTRKRRRENHSDSTMLLHSPFDMEKSDTYGFGALGANLRSREIAIEERESRISEKMLDLEKRYQEFLDRLIHKYEFDLNRRIQEFEREKAEYYARMKEEREEIRQEKLEIKKEKIEIKHEIIELRNERDNLLKENTSLKKELEIHSLYNKS